MLGPAGPFHGAIGAGWSRLELPVSSMGQPWPLPMEGLQPLASTWARAPYGPALIGIPVKLLTYQLNVYLLILLSNVIISLLSGSGSFGVTEIPVLV